MRILQLISQSRVGGAEVVGFTLASEFARRGNPTLLLSNRANGPLLDRPHAPGMVVAALPRTHRYDARIVPFLLGRASGFRPDVIHAHGWEASVWGRLLGLANPGVAVICHMHSSQFVHRHTRWRILIDRLLYSRADAVLVLNEIQKEFLLRVGRLDPRKLHVVPNGIDLDRFSPLPGQRRNHSAVCVANFTNVKNHESILRAWKLVVAEVPDARLTLVGSGPLEEDLRGQARASGLGDQVVFAGPRDDVRPFLWDAQIFVLFSHLEALPLALLEAMAAGCACVTSAVGGIPEVLEHGRTGVLVPAGDVAALSAAVVQLLRNDRQRDALAADGGREVARRFALDPWLDRILGICDECTRRRRSGRRPGRRC